MIFFLKTFREPAFLTVYSLGAEQENDPSYIVVREFGTYNDPLSADRKFRVCTCDTGFSKFDMSSGLRTFNALYVNTALLKCILFGTENQPSSLNINQTLFTQLHDTCKTCGISTYKIAYNLRYGGGIHIHTHTHTHARTHARTHSIRWSIEFSARNYATSTFFCNFDRRSIYVPAADPPCQRTIIDKRENVTLVKHRLIFN